MCKSDNIDILVNIRNKAEDAYEARLIIDMPPGIQYNGDEKYLGRTEGQR
jgi:hypothetical protein